MKFRFNRQVLEDLRQDLRRASWAVPAAIYGSGLLGLSKEVSLIGAVLAWAGLQALAFLLGCLET